MPQKLQLKEACYRCWGHGPKFPKYNKVLYVIIDDCCYFSGIEKDLRTSTINAAESIIQAISGQEGINVARLRWFDLLTYSGYHKIPGEYELAEITIGPDTLSLMADENGCIQIEVDGEEGMLLARGGEDFVVTCWDYKAPCPDKILEIFHKYIGFDFYSRSVDNLKISSHITSCLKSRGVKTIGELIQWDPTEFILENIFIFKDVNEIYDALEPYMLRLDMGWHLPPVIKKLLNK